MERNYMGQGGYAGGSQSNMVSSGRRAGQVRSAGSDDRPPLGYSASYGSDSSQASQMPRYGRRASPVAAPAVGGMEMDPPRYQPSAASGAQPLARPARVAATPPSGASAGSGAAAGAGAGAGSKLSGLARLKEAAAARLTNRIPSANGRSSGADAGGYVPSVMTNQQPARVLPGRTSSSGADRGGGSSGSYSNGYSGSSGYSGSAGGGRSASTGPAMGAGARPPADRSNGTSGAAGGYGGGYGGSSASGGSRQPANGYAGSGGSGGYSSSSSRPPQQQQQQYQQQPSGYGRSGDYGQPAPAARQAPPARPAPAPAPPQQMARPHHHSHHQGGGGHGGGGFPAGSIPPGADSVPTGPMVECPTCGRSFNQQAYSKHAKVCEKVFATKRKPVNMAAKRLEGSEAVKFFDLRKNLPKSEAKQAPAAAPGRGGRGNNLDDRPLPGSKASAAAPGRGGRGNNLDDRPLPGSKVPKWKAQSEQLRAAMAANRQIVDAKAQGKDIRDIKFAGPSIPDDRVQCPHCGRKFAELTAERHIPKCRDIQAKPGRLAAGSGRGAHMRR